MLFEFCAIPQPELASTSTSLAQSSLCPPPSISSSIIYMIPCGEGGGRSAPGPTCLLLGIADSLTRRFNLLPEEQDADVPTPAGITGPPKVDPQLLAAQLAAVWASILPQLGFPGS